MNWKRIAQYVIVMSVMSVALKMVMAAPVPPDTISIDASGRHQSSTSGFQIEAQAGNVTALNITHVQTTQFWQGYVGNISGSIVLDDGDNNTLFSWENARPQGEVYAVNSSASVNWNNVTCVNWSARVDRPALENSSQRINLTTLLLQYNMNLSNLNEWKNVTKDTFNTTFNSTFDSTITIAETTLGDEAKDTENCNMLYTFVDQAYQTSRFKEVLLYDNDSALIFATIIEDSASGFKPGSNDLYDFQMLVAEDGSPGQEAITTTYYFYVELE